MKNFLLLIALIFSFAFDAAATTPKLDATSTVICAIVNYSHSIGGPIMTVVIIGAALLAVFGRMPWPALVALGIFTGAFFGAPAIVEFIAPKATHSCKSTTCEQGKTWSAKDKKCV
ncbi:TrbC/VirB2 family protein [Wolbachia endosymbiont of Pentalonia nigronervosa]|uniref:TrbC/VirB2 family protein n=1 Tax=Wolbachia endosymbiont of Pentalonia nigronervosa TaxID=1301914 RepID=UPI00165F1090|nr:TrbC/VirB2 family protein [Wolbachia endosymbiont of Pentalonia nigronervosa]MBD0391816.1 TrbC/VirB2 family protein [Wolbachia endosymbiont of Pentalonia nigronervosa]